MSKPQRKPYNNPEQAKYTEGLSYEESAEYHLANAKREIRTFEHPQTGGWSDTLRKAATYLKMAADRMDHAKILKKETLPDFVEGIT